MGVSRVRSKPKPIAKAFVARNDTRGSKLLLGIYGVVVLALSVFPIFNIFKVPVVLDADAWSLEADLQRQCLSPENVSWPLDSCVDMSLPSTTIGRSSVSSLTCGFCHQNKLTNYFMTTSNVLHTLSQQQQKCRTIIYSVLFDSQRRRIFMQLSKYPGQYPDRNCRFLFVLESSIHAAKREYYSVYATEGRVWEHNLDKSVYYVSVPDAFLPYQNMRRNVKLIKLHGHQIFFWSNRLFWADAKFPPSFVPTESLNHFYSRTMEVNNVCAVFIGLPNHHYTMGSRFKILGSPNFEDSCQAILTSTQTRNVTDSAEAIQYLCDMYLYRHTASTKQAYQEVINQGLVDSALIAWNTQSQRCRQFNADLACTWGDEIQCYADRDQLSFPYAFQSMKLQNDAFASSQTTNPALHNQIWVDPLTRLPMLEIVKSSCHWYMTPTLDCDLEGQDVFDSWLSTTGVNEVF